MMRIDHVAEPPDFKVKVHDKGAQWLAKSKNAVKEPTDLCVSWSCGIIFSPWKLSSQS